MAKADSVFLYIGTYPNEAAARAAYDVVKDLLWDHRRSLCRSCLP